MIMERNMLLLFLLPVVHVDMKGNTGTHFFVNQMKNWTAAQTYCREKYTDLSIVRNPTDTENMLQAANGKHFFSWIGLYRDPDDVNGWKWFEGGHITYSNWAAGEPNNFKQLENKGGIKHDGRWYDLPENLLLPFYCIKFPWMEEEKKSWEEALDHCRNTQTDLISIVSETDQRFIHRELQHRHFKDLLWIGLRFLGDRWLWVNGDPLGYVAWPEGGDGDHLCPVRKRCGALNKDGRWQNIDCAEKLNFLCN